MTNIQIIESIMQVFPEVGETQAIAEMNTAQNRFARETGIIQKVGSLSSLTSQVSWSLPTGVVEIYEVELYDSDGKRLHRVNEDIDWVVDDDRIIFYATSLDTDGSTITKITTIPTSINAIYVRYTALPTAIAARATSQTDDIPTEFRDAIFYGALATLYGRIRQPLQIGSDGNAVMGIDRNSRDYWEAKFKQQVIEAKKFVNSRDTSYREAINYQDPGMTVLPREAKDANVSTTAWT